MDREDVDSSAIASVGFSLSYLIETELPLVDLPGTLEIEFVDGSIYTYEDVPTSVYKELMDAPSLGAYFNAEIRDSYDGQQA
jgi:hypothetical protein